MSQDDECDKQRKQQLLLLKQLKVEIEVTVRGVGDSEKCWR